MVMRFLSPSPSAPPALAAMLEFVGLPAVLVSERGHRIVAANLEASHHSGYSRQGLTSLAWEQLFPELSWEMLTSLESQEILTFLQRRDGSSQKMTCQAHALASREGFWLVMFSPLPAGGGKTEPRESVLERVIRQSVEGLETLEPSVMLERLLAEMTRVVEATWGALYLVETPAYRLRAKVGAVPDIPLALPLQHEVHVGRPQVLGPTDVAETALHAVVRTSEAPYMVLAPLGKDQAVEGFVALGYGVQPPAGTLRRVMLLARGLRQVILCRLRWQEGRQEVLRSRQMVGVLRTLLHEAYEGVLLFDREMHLVTLSRSATELLGYTAEEAEGAAFNDLLVGEVALETAARQTLALGRSQEMVAHLLRRDGTEFPAEVRVSPCVPEGEERPQGLVVVVRDLSTEERYRMQTQRLMWRAMLGDVLASFAHEVRDPLNSISTGLEWLEISLAEDAPERQTVAMLQQDVGRLNHLVTHLLDYSRTRNLQLKPLDIRRLLQSILRRWARRFERHRIETTFHVAPDVPLVLGDKLSLEQVFINLLDNAIRAVQNQPGDRFVGVKVSKSVSENGVTWVEVAVTDNGPGFTEEVGRRIFEPFFTTREDGFGLGLSITKQLVTAHRGSIDAFSYPAGGTVFHVLLRAAERG